MRDLLIIALILLLVYLFTHKEVEGLPAPKPKKAHNREEWKIIRDSEGRLERVVITREVVFE